LYEGKSPLKGRAVFLSASKPSREPFRAVKLPEIEEAVLSLARAVFAQQGRLVFGGHPTISPLVASVASEYFPERRRRSEDPPVIIYQSKAYEKWIPNSTAALEEMGYAEIRWTEKQEGEEFQPGLEKEQCLKSLHHMRARMFEETAPIVMVAGGGMEGVIREARLFLEMTPHEVYVLESTGGASEHLVQHLEENFLKEANPMAAPRWRKRIHTLEAEYGSRDWDRRSDETLPLAPYALLMQQMVRAVAYRVE
jgi:hypothetical protein